VQAYNSNVYGSRRGGLGPRAAELIAEGEFTALKLRLGRRALNDDYRHSQRARISRWRRETDGGLQQDSHLEMPASLPCTR